MPFYGIYDGHKKSYDHIKVWHYGYQINRVDLTVEDKYNTFNFQYQGNRKSLIRYFQDFPLCTSLYEIGGHLRDPLDLS